MRLNGRYLGKAILSPQKDVVAGQAGEWKIVYTVGRYGLDDGGALRFAWRSVSDWEIPQFERPCQFGYTSVQASRQVRVSAEYSPYIRHFQNSILIRITDGSLYEGDTLTVTLGDRSMGSPGIRAQSFCESEHEIRVLVDPFGTNRFEKLPDSLWLAVVGGTTKEIQAVLPGTVRPNEEFDIVIRCLDQYGNASYFEGEVELGLSDDARGESRRKVAFLPGDAGVRRIEGNRIATEGAWRVRLSGTKKGFSGTSNFTECVEHRKYSLYWGDMHGQTSYTVGTGSLDDYFSFARDVAALDFTGWQGNDFEIDNEKWADVRDKVRKYNTPGSFVVFLGYEWSGNTPTGGDHNIFFLDDNTQYYPSSNWLAEGSIDPTLNVNPISELWDRLRGRKDVLAIPHVGGRYGNFDFFDPEFISVIELHSHHGTFEWFALDAMRRRLKVGFVGASDDHTCRPGLSYPLSGKGKSASVSFDVASGFTGIYATELSKKAIWEALKARRCYATTFARIVLDVRIGDHIMGEEISSNTPPELLISVKGTAPIESVRIYNWDRLIHEDFLLPRTDPSRVEFRWSGVRSRSRRKSNSWDGMILVEDGRIAGAEEIAFNRLEQGIKALTDTQVEWTSSTSGNFNGVVLDIDGNEKTLLSFLTDTKRFTIPLSEIGLTPTTLPAGGENLEVQVMRAADPLNRNDEKELLKRCMAELCFTDNDTKQEKQSAYWIKVTQMDGHMAWSSPIFVMHI